MNKKIEYKVIRTYKEIEPTNLQELFDDGWEYVACNHIGVNTLEYVVAREVLL